MGSARRLNSPQVGLNSAELGLWIFLATVTMLFAGFTSAYIVRSAGPDWQPIPLPPILWFNTIVIAASSVALESGRARSSRWIWVAALLGLIFLIGQLFAWRLLAARGFYLPSNPHSAFFYILSGLHGLHLLAGICALAYLLIRGERSTLSWRLCATYWHFVGALWVYLLLVLFAT
jgi:cytochrome c oxidase subunit 3